MSQNLRRSARITDPSYRRRTTWSLPHILTVCFFFFSGPTVRAHTDLQGAGSRRENTSHLKEYHTNVAVSPAEENASDIENVGTFSGKFLTQSLQSSLFT